MVGQDWASVAARRILADCHHRYGIRLEFAATPFNVVEDRILPAWASIIRLAAIDQLQRMDGEESI